MVPIVLGLVLQGVKCFMKKKFMYLLLALAVAFVPSQVLAKVRGVITTDTDVSHGDKLNASIRLVQEGGSDEISVYQAVIEYDENLFSGIDESSFKTKSGWGQVQYNAKTHSIILINNYGSGSTEDVVSFDFLLKANARPTTTKVRLTNQVVSNEGGDYTLEDAASTVDVNAFSGSPSSGNVSSAVYGQPLVQAPVRLYYIVTLIVLELVIAIILFAIFKVMQKNVGNMILRRIFGGTLVIIEFFALSAVFTYDVRKGDLNGDKLVNADDVAIMSKHLVNAEMMSEFKLENADMNGDGLVTPADLALLIGRVGGKKTYEVKLANAVMESNGYEKGTVADIRFFADVTNDAEVEYVVMDGKKQKVEKVGGKEYAIKVPTPTVSKKYNYNITEVGLANGKKASVDYGTDLVVLKDAPELSGFSMKEDLANSSVKVALTLTDVDAAIVSAKYELVTSIGKVVESGRLDRGKSSLEFKLDNAVSYKLKIKIDYNRGEGSGEYYGSIEDEYDMRIITDYRLTMGNFNLVQNGVSTKYLEKGSETYLTFTSSNVSGYAPRKLTVNGREYAVSSLGYGSYRVSIPNWVLDGSDLVVSKTTLANGKVILVDGRIGYTVLKNRPVITALKANESVSDALMHVSFDLSDKDESINRLVVRLYDEANRLVSEKVVTDQNYNVDLASAWTSKYTIRVYADYTRASGYTASDEVLYETQVEAAMRADVQSFGVDEMYPEKNSIIDLDYVVTSNYNVNVKQVVINNVIYDVQKVGVNTYRVEMNVGGNSGVQEYETKKIIFENGHEEVVNETTRIDVQKSYPVLENFVVNEDVQDSRIDVAFDLFDFDGAFRSGKVSLIDKETAEVVQSKDVILGKNSATFYLDNAVKYDISIDVNGVLDTESFGVESPNRFEGYNLYRNEYRIVSDYGLEISDIITLDDGVVTNQFGANGEVEVQFASTNVTEYVPVKVKVNGNYYDLTVKDDKYSFVVPGFIESGDVTLRFESLVLSNGKELELSVFKRIEILKRIPSLEEISIRKYDGDLVGVQTLIDDRDEALFEVKGVILDIYGNVIFNGDIVDGSFQFDKQGNVVYTVRIVASYDLNNDTDIMEENRHMGEVIYESVVNELDGGFQTSSIEDVVLYKKETGEVIERVNDEVLNELDSLMVKLVIDEETSMDYDIYSYTVDEKTVTFILKHHGWVTTSDGERTNLIKVEFELYDEES